ncbi:MAG: alpha/beta fold hydrolase [Acidimicrobiia bacterium]
MNFVFVHSPFVGKSTWVGVAAALEDRFDTVVVDLHRPGVVVSNAGHAAEIGAHLGSDSVVVVHSGAGPLIPAAVAVAAPAAVLFVDAALPFSQTRAGVYPPGLMERLLTLSVGETLARWDRWFPPDALEELLTDPEVRHRFVAELPSLPVSYMTESLTAAGQWEGLPCGFLQLSAAYRDELALAEQRRWVVATCDGDHLWPLTRPTEVARELESIAAELV